ncbi:MAG: M64 family metallopeptidase [Prevotellaceae bacterium]|nr:M64 family metallopeptidase [Prevotellaceae bacterium]MDO4932366.1 M64 family metallopeptidase [Prevotellaceae bacterium]
MKKKHFLPFISLLMCMASCNSGNEEQITIIDHRNPTDKPNEEVPDGKTPEVLYADSIAKLSNVTMLQQHTKGDGFHIVIMADGYTKEDINNGRYRNAVLAAKNAIFAQKPMRDLEEYVDIIEVMVPSLHSGVDYTKRQTGLRTSLQQGNSTNVYGDSLTILQCAWTALRKTYNNFNNSQAEGERRLGNTLVLALLNTNVYKGVTLLADDKEATDKIPGGYSLSYVPAYATVQGRNVFADLVRHEGVGHGIAKLGDEYHYDEAPYNSVPQKDVARFTEGQKIGFFMNIGYDATGSGDVEGRHPIEATSWLYPFTQMAEYAGEDLHWYKGAFEYSTGFYRSSNHSIMNATTEAGNETFNVASRAMIYKRIMRAAYGKSWQFDYNAFRTFDSPAATPALHTARAARAIPSVVKAPMLEAPRFIKIEKFNIK